MKKNAVLFIGLAGIFIIIVFVKLHKNIYNCAVYSIVINDICKPAKYNFKDQEPGFFYLVKKHTSKEALNGISYNVIKEDMPLISKKLYDSLKFADFFSGNINCKVNWPENAAFFEDKSDVISRDSRLELWIKQSDGKIMKCAVVSMSGVGFDKDENKAAVQVKISTGFASDYEEVYVLENKNGTWEIKSRYLLENRDVIE